MRRAGAAVAMAMKDWQFARVSRWKRITFALLLSGVLGCLPMRGHAAGLDCPDLGPGSVPNLLNDLQIKLIASGDSVDLANEINDLVNKLQILKPNISYAELTNIVIAAFCPVVASTNLTASEKWNRMRQFDTILQRQLAADMLPPGTLIVANIPLPPAVYRELRNKLKTKNCSWAFSGTFLLRTPARTAGRNVNLCSVGDVADLAAQPVWPLETDV